MDESVGFGNGQIFEVGEAAALPRPQQTDQPVLGFGLHRQEEELVTETEHIHQEDVCRHLDKQKREKLTGKRSPTGADIEEDGLPGVEVVLLAGDHLESGLRVDRGAVRVAADALEVVRVVGQVLETPRLWGKGGGGTWRSV